MKYLLLLGLATAAVVNREAGKILENFFTEFLREWKSIFVR